MLYAPCATLLFPMAEIPSEQKKVFSIIATKSDEGTRLDQFLAGTDLQISRSHAKTLIEKHFILLNQKPTKPSTHVKAGDGISLSLPEPETVSLNP